MTETKARPVEISKEQKEQYQEEGYFILESAMDDAMLAYIRGECDRLTEEMEAQKVLHYQSEPEDPQPASVHFQRSHG